MNYANATSALIAEALVECGYAQAINPNRYGIDRHGIYYVDSKQWVEPNPFADTLEGRRQADALEDWLDKIYKDNLWIQSRRHCIKSTNRQWRLDRIKWCFEQMEESNE